MKLIIFLMFFSFSCKTNKIKVNKKRNSIENFADFEDIKFKLTEIEALKKVLEAVWKPGATKNESLVRVLDAVSEIESVDKVPDFFIIPDGEADSKGLRMFKNMHDLGLIDELNYQSITEQINSKQDVFKALKAQGKNWREAFRDYKNLGSNRLLDDEKIANLLSLDTKESFLSIVRSKGSEVDRSSLKIEGDRIMVPNPRGPEGSYILDKKLTAKYQKHRAQKFAEAITGYIDGESRINYDFFKKTNGTSSFDSFLDSLQRYNLIASERATSLRSYFNAPEVQENIQSLQKGELDKVFQRFKSGVLDNRGVQKAKNLVSELAGMDASVIDEAGFRAWLRESSRSTTITGGASEIDSLMQSLRSSGFAPKGEDMVGGWNSWFLARGWGKKQVVDTLINNIKSTNSAELDQKIIKNYYNFIPDDQRGHIGDIKNLIVKKRADGNKVIVWIGEVTGNSFAEELATISTDSTSGKVEITTKAITAGRFGNEFTQTAGIKVTVDPFAENLASFKQTMKAVDDLTKVKDVKGFKGFIQGELNTRLVADLTSADAGARMSFLAQVESAKGMGDKVFGVKYQKEGGIKTLVESSFKKQIENMTPDQKRMTGFTLDFLDKLLDDPEVRQNIILDAFSAMTTDASGKPLSLTELLSRPDLDVKGISARILGSAVNQLGPINQKLIQAAVGNMDPAVGQALEKVKSGLEPMPSYHVFKRIKASKMKTESIRILPTADGAVRTDADIDKLPLPDEMKSYFKVSSALNLNTIVREVSPETDLDQALNQKLQDEFAKAYFDENYSRIEFEGEGDRLKIYSYAYDAEGTKTRTELDAESQVFKDFKGYSNKVVRNEEIKKFEQFKIALEKGYLDNYLGTEKGKALVGELELAEFKKKILKNSLILTSNSDDFFCWQRLSTASIGDVGRVYNSTSNPQIVKLTKYSAVNASGREKKILNDLFADSKYKDLDLLIKQMYRSYERTVDDELDLRKEVEALQKLEVYKTRKTINGTKYELDVVGRGGALGESVSLDKGKPQRVMVMDNAPGKTLSELVSEQQAKLLLNPGDTKATEELKKLENAMDLVYSSWYKEALVGGGNFHGDLHSGNMLVDVQKNGTYKITLIDAGGSGTLEPKLRKNILQMMTTLDGKYGRSSEAKKAIRKILAFDPSMTIENKEKALSELDDDIDGIFERSSELDRLERVNSYLQAEGFAQIDSSAFNKTLNQRGDPSLWTQETDLSLKTKVEAKLNNTQAWFDYFKNIANDKTMTFEKFHELSGLSKDDFKALRRTGLPDGNDYSQKQVELRENIRKVLSDSQIDGELSVLKSKITQRKKTYLQEIEAQYKRHIDPSERMKKILDSAGTKGLKVNDKFMDFIRAQIILDSSMKSVQAVSSRDYTKSKFEYKKAISKKFSIKQKKLLKPVTHNLKSINAAIDVIPSLKAAKRGVQGVAGLGSLGAVILLPILLLSEEESSCVFSFTNVGGDILIAENSSQDDLCIAFYGLSGENITSHKTLCENLLGRWKESKCSKNLSNVCYIPSANEYAALDVFSKDSFLGTAKELCKQFSASR